MNRRTIIGVVCVLSVVIGALVSVVFASELMAASRFTIQAGANAAQGDSQPAELFGSAGIFTVISNLLLFVIGALSVVMIIFGGLRYVVSGGNATAVTAAKNTIVYAIVGLIVAFLAYAVINFILGSLASGTPGTNI